MITGAIRRRLARAFVVRSLDVTAYSNRALDECGGFPEGDLFPFVFPAIALAARSRTGDVPREHALAASRAMLDSARETVRRTIGEPSTLRAGVRQGVYVGWLALAHGVYREASGDGRYDDERRALCAVLRDELDEAGGGPLDSFPGIRWPFDTVPPLVALAVSDRIDGTCDAAWRIERHHAWVLEHAMDDATGLPSSLVGDRPPFARSAPRGCDLSLRFGMLRLLAPELARTWYGRYTRAFWCERGWLAGFREYPKGSSKGGADPDSGPIVAEVGMAASAFGLAATRTMGDRLRYGRLAMQLAAWDAVWRLAGLVAGERLRAYRPMGDTMRIDPEYVTGFLFGDACLFLTLSWPEAESEYALTGVEVNAEDPSSRARAPGPTRASVAAPMPG
ncbi:MAG: hypothetical protein HZA61_04625 [Candidatus Eisenbacteria bacterium]|uniref:Uncharacterized protein n=1 Tax=Eiseniibacteriota bacterium TaxID=2212470 RepID=A0A933SC80_UNCEI|nr:hypothetical protein [Candidatus Eisenbacteria bacterium]